MEFTVQYRPCALFHHFFVKFISHFVNGSHALLASVDFLRYCQVILDFWGGRLHIDARVCSVIIIGHMALNLD
jgi:hypothetical protein